MALVEGFAKLEFFQILKTHEKVVIHKLSFGPYPIIISLILAPLIMALVQDYEFVFFSKYSEKT